MHSQLFTSMNLLPAIAIYRYYNEHPFSDIEYSL